MQYCAFSVECVSFGLLLFAPLSIIVTRKHGFTAEALKLFVVVIIATVVSVTASRFLDESVTFQRQFSAADILPLLVL